MNEKQLVARIGVLLRSVSPSERRRIASLVLLEASSAPEHSVNSLRKTARELGHRFADDVPPGGCEPCNCIGPGGCSYCDDNYDRGPR